MYKKSRNKKRNPEYEKMIFDMFYHRVYNTAYFIVKDSHLAHDVLQDTFLKAFQNIDRVQDGNKLGAWLGTIATRTAIDYIRKQKRRNDIPMEDVYIDNKDLEQSKDSSVEAIVDQKFLKKIIETNIDNLEPPEYREVIILKYEYELKEKEIAEALEISLGATKTRLHRAKKKLKSAMAEYSNARGGDTL